MTSARVGHVPASGVRTAPWVVIVALACCVPPPAASGASGTSPPVRAQPEPPPSAPGPAIELEGVLNRALVERLGAPEAWLKSQGDGVIVAVMDSGFYRGDPLMAEAYAEEELQFENVVHRQDTACGAGSASRRRRPQRWR